MSGFRVFGTVSPRLPRPLAFLYLFFTAFPLVAIALPGAPWSLLVKAPWPTLLLQLSAYALLPAVLCAALSHNQHWLLPAYIAHCCTLVVLLLWGDFVRPLEREVIYGMLLGSMIYMAFLFGSRNLLYPMLVRDIRLWRRAARYQIGRPVRALLPSGEVSAVLLDCSNLGLSLQLSPEDCRNHAGPLGGKFHVVIPAGPEPGRPSFRLPVELVWKRTDDPDAANLGCRALDPSLFRRFLSQEPLAKPARPRFSGVHREVDLEEDIRQSALILWVLCIGLALLLPVS